LRDIRRSGYRPRIVVPSPDHRVPRPTFPAYADRSGFNALLPSRAPRPRAEGDLAVDHAVVGAGFTGLAAACRLAQLEPQSRIVVVEATEIGEGASARNSGFAGPRDLPAGPTAADRARATALDRFAGEGWAWLMDQVETHGIDCALRLSGRIRAAATARGAARVEALRDAVAAADMAHEMLDRAALEERIGTAYYRCALFTPDGFVLDPAALVRGLADALPANVVLCENTPLLSLAHRERWQLETPAARIAARNVVLATNAAIRKLGHLRDRLVTIYTYAALTAPLAPADAARLGTMPVWGLLPAHRLGTTVRRVGDDRLLLRSLYAHERPLPEAQVRTTLLSCFHRRYPALAHAGLDRIWGGTTALTMNGAPWWGRIDNGLYASAGCNGSGIVKGSVLGKRLAELVVGHGDQDDVRTVWGRADWVAPEPFRSIGFAVIAAVERRRAGLET
jgi:glycine/D-amino acid oxidase-like deaminating enzyme